MCALPAQHWGVGTGNPELQWVSHQLLVVVQRDPAMAWKGQRLRGEAACGHGFARLLGTRPAPRQHPRQLRSPGRLCFPSPAQHCAVSANTRPGSRQLRTAFPQGSPDPAPRGTREALPPW